MSGGEIAAVVGAVTGVLTLGLLLVWVVSVTKALTSLQHHVEELRREPGRGYVAERVEAQVVEATPVAARRPVPKLAAVAFSDPMIKAVAFATGTARAVRTFRRA